MLLPILIYRIILRLLALGIHEKEKDTEEDNKTIKVYLGCVQTFTPIAPEYVADLKVHQET